MVPILDKGETPDEYVLVMPRAEMSLADHLQERGALGEVGAIPILLDVAEALEGLEGRIVHRDLKPDNVLLLNGRWCISDFGISRYADASTRTAHSEVRPHTSVRFPGAVEA